VIELKIRDSRKSGSPLETLQVGKHSPGDEIEVDDALGQRIIETSPIFKEVKTRRRAEEKEGEKK
jgi:hypothetical protein